MCYDKERENHVRRCNSTERREMEKDAAYIKRSSV